MNIETLLAFLTRAAILVITALTLVEYLRARGPVRLKTLLMIGDLGLIVVGQLVMTAGWGPLPWVGQLNSMLLMAHPYLLLLLVGELRPVASGLQALALAGLVGSWAGILAFPGDVPTPAALLMVVYFACLELYAAGQLVYGARRASGVTHWRLLLAAAGSACIALVILIAGAETALQGLRPFLSPLASLLGLFSILGYFLGFTPPRWLRRPWQERELHNYLTFLAEQSEETEEDQVLRHLCLYAGRAVGGALAETAVWQADRAALVLRASSQPGEDPEPDWLDLPQVGVAWAARRPQLLLRRGGPKPGALPPPDWGGQIRGLYIVPIQAHSRSLGLLAVYLYHSPLFPDDDLDLLALFCEQSAIRLNYLALVVEQKGMVSQLNRFNQRLKTLRQIDRAILSARSPRQVAGAAMTRLRQLVPSQRISIALFDQEAGVASYLAVMNDPKIGPQEGERLPISDLPKIEALNGKNSPYQNQRDLTLLPDPPPMIRQMIELGARSIMIRPLLVEGEPTGFMSISSTQVNAFDEEHEEIAQEVTEQVAVALQQARLREELQRSNDELERRVAERTAELQAANQELEAFAYSVSHDLRAPLRAIDGFSRVVLTRYTADLPEEGRHYLEMVRNSTHQMGQLIDDLLSFSRINRKEIKKQWLHPGELVQAVLLELGEGGAGRAQVEVKDLPPCLADPALLKQVFANLLSNALKFSSKRAEPRIEVGCKVEAGSTIFYVKDNGVGFDMQYVHKLFGVFQRLHRAEEFEGTGVGLAIIQRIITRHGGRVWAEGQVDQGAVFYFSLPCEPSAGLKELKENAANLEDPAGRR